MKLITTAAAALLVTAVSASAASFDFGEYARDNGEGSWDYITGGDITDGGITVEAGSFLHDGVSVIEDARDTSVAYLDGPNSSDLNAGLGVCTAGIGGGGTGECLIGGDDNTGATPAGGASAGLFEGLVLRFSSAVTLSDLVFRDADHVVINSGLIAVGDATAEQPGDLTVWDIGGDFFDYGSTQWVFAAIGGEGIEFYIDGVTATTVPLPAAGWLLIGGLGGLAAMKRRKKAA